MCVCARVSVRVSCGGRLGLTPSMHAPTVRLVLTELLRYIRLCLASNECCLPLCPSKTFTTPLSSSLSIRHRRGVTADSRLALHSLRTPSSAGGRDACRNAHSALCRSDSEQATEQTGRRQPFGQLTTSCVRWQPTHTGESTFPRGPVKQCHL